MGCFGGAWGEALGLGYQDFTLYRYRTDRRTEPVQKCMPRQQEISSISLEISLLCQVKTATARI